MQIMILVWIQMFSAEYKLDPVLVEAIVRTEAGFAKDRKTYNHLAKGGIGEIGLMQMRKEYLDSPQTYYNPYKNLKEGVKRLAELKKLEKELGEFWFVAWNLGPTGALKFHKARGISRAPYTRMVFKNYFAIKREMKKRPLDIRYAYAPKDPTLLVYRD